MLNFMISRDCNHMNRSAWGWSIVTTASFKWWLNDYVLKDVRGDFPITGLQHIPASISERGCSCVRSSFGNGLSSWCGSHEAVSQHSTSYSTSQWWENSLSRLKTWILHAPVILWQISNSYSSNTNNSRGQRRAQKRAERIKNRCLVWEAGVPTLRVPQIFPWRSNTSTRRYAASKRISRQTQMRLPVATKGVVVPHLPLRVTRIWTSKVWKLAGEWMVSDSDQLLDCAWHIHIHVHVHVCALLAHHNTIEGY